MCAHAVRVAIEKLEGVEAVEVSLNEGFAHITFTEANTVTLREVQQAVVRHGFTPRDARIRARGRVTTTPDRAVFSVRGTGESFTLEGDVGMLSELAASGEATVVGIVRESRDRAPLTLQVSRLPEP